MSRDLSPTARALLALDLIQSSPGIRGEDLAARLRVSDRAARRYVGILRDAGVPVESASGPYGGYRVGRGARVPPLVFSTDEALGLVMAVLRGWHGSVESDQPGASALRKIVRVLPRTASAPVEALRRVLVQNPGEAAAEPDPTLTAALARCCEDRQQVRLRYRSAPGHERDLVVDPWAVVVRHGRWYLLCWSRAAGARRVLRLDRVLALERTGEPGEAPDVLDPVSEVEEHLADGWSHQVEVRVQAGLERVAGCVPRTLGRLEAVDDDSCVLRGSTDEPDWYAAQLAALPAPFTVTGSPAVRRSVQQLADRLAGAC